MQQHYQESLREIKKKGECNGDINVYTFSGDRTEKYLPFICNNAYFHLGKHSKFICYMLCYMLYVLCINNEINFICPPKPN